MVLGDESIELLDLLGWHRPHDQMREDLLFVGRGVAERYELFILHVRQRKKTRPGCPAKSFKSFYARNLPPPKDAPYSRGVHDKILRTRTFSPLFRQQV